MALKMLPKRTKKMSEPSSLHHKNLYAVAWATLRENQTQLDITQQSFSSH